MHHARRTFVATGLVALLALAGVTAAIAADPAQDPPPRIAFLANGIVPADALAAGSIAGQLGAPVFTTPPDSLSAPAADGLTDHDPELVIVLGGPVAIQDGVLARVSSVTGLAIKDPDSRPDSGIVRAAGQTRFDTAKVVAQLVGDYDPAHLGVDLKAADSDMLDGKDSSAFQPAGDYLGATETAADSALLEGRTSTEVAFPPTLPLGKTLRGALMIDDHATGATQFYGTHITFSPPLPARLVDFELITDTPSDDCPGAVEDPQAAPGHLCVYQQTSSSAAGPLRVLYDSTTIGGPLGRHGALLEVLSQSAGDIFVQATWAATPTAPGTQPAPAATQPPGTDAADGRG